MDKKLEKIYLKDKYNKFNSLFNIWCLLFGSFYILYRKLYVLGIIAFAINIILYFCKLYWVILILNIILSFIFNRLYLKTVRYKIYDYKLKYMDNSLVKKECSKKATNINVVIIIIAVSVVILVISNIDFQKYKIQISDLSLELDNNWTANKYNNDYYAVYNYDNVDKCSITIEALGHTSEEEFINEMLQSYSYYGNIEKININGIEYTFVTIENNTATHYIYTTYKDKLYVILFDIYEDSGVCKKYKDEILNAVRIKN